jgi:hypothetical protein
MGWCTWACASSPGIGWLDTLDFGYRSLKSYIFGARNGFPQDFHGVFNRDVDCGVKIPYCFYMPCGKAGVNSLM